MIRATIGLGTAATLTALAGCAPGESIPAPGAGRVQSGQSEDQVVTLSECPAEVQTTIQAHLHGGAIKEIERTTDHGEVLYEVDVTTDEGVIEFDVAEDGTFRGYEEDDDDDAGEDEDGPEDDMGLDDDDDDGDEDDEEEIPLADVPDNIMQAALAAVPGLVLEEAAIERDGDTVTYELEGEAGGKEYEIEVSGAGEVLEVEVDEDEDDDAGDDDD